MIGIKCCKNCTERYIGCHSSCERYLKEKEVHEHISDEHNRENNARVIYSPTRRKRGH